MGGEERPLTAQRPTEAVTSSMPARIYRPIPENQENETVTWLCDREWSLPEHFVRRACTSAGHGKGGNAMLPSTAVFLENLIIRTAAERLQRLCVRQQSTPH